MIDVVIVNWNSGRQLESCIDSLFRYGSKEISKVIIVDNGSVDNSLSFDTSSIKIKIVKAGENLGFGKACNLGASFSDSEFILFLNPDAAIYKDSLRSATDYLNLEKNSTVGICGVSLVDESGEVTRSCARFPSASRLIMHSIGLTSFLPSLGSPMREWDHGEIKEVDQVIGAFFLVRKNLFDMLKGFDERFFVYYEEVDFSRRARVLGWKSIYLADVHSFHAGGGTSNQVKAKRLFYSLRSRLLYAFKHFSFLGALTVLIFTILLEPFSRSAMACFKRSWKGVQETWIGYAMLLNWIVKRSYR